jgi:hypothetical protein
MTKSIPRGNLMFVQIAVIDIEALGERVLNLERFKTYQADRSRIIIFCHRNGVWKMAAWRVVAEENLRQRISSFLARQVCEDDCFDSRKIYPVFHQDRAYSVTRRDLANDLSRIF